jgi:hypothetical protein
MARGEYVGGDPVGIAFADVLRIPEALSNYHMEVDQ